MTKQEIDAEALLRYRKHNRLCLQCGSKDLHKKADGTFALLCSICIYRNIGIVFNSVKK